MQQTARLAILAMCAVLGSAAAATTSHPVEKVITMLQGLAEDSEAEGKAEALLYEKFDYWCRNSIKALTSAIEEETAAIESLQDKIAAGEAKEKSLEDQIAALEVRIGALGQRQAKITADREAANKLYIDTEKDLSGTVTGIADAIAALEKSQAEELMQVLATPKVRSALALAEAAADGKQRVALSALLQHAQKKQPEFKERPDQLAAGDEAAHVQGYDFKSGDVIETLKQLKLRFEDEVTATNKAETASVNAYELASEALEDETTAATNSKSEKESVLAETKSDLATWGGELESEKSDLASDQKTLEATEKGCTVKKTEWQDRSAVRSTEIAAIGEAVKILAKATGVQTKPPSNPVPPPSPVSLSQRRAPPTHHSAAALVQTVDPRQKALELLRATAQKTHSESMERLVQQLSTHLNDPFAEVTNIIEKMVFHLMNEQTQEDEHKAWCDKELSHSNASAVDKESKIEDLSAKIDTADAFVAKLTSDIAEAQSKIASMAAFMQEATEIREIGKKENAAAIADAEKAQAAIADATAVIKAFYKETGRVEKASWELLQKHAGKKQPVELPDTPETWGASYTGVGDPAEQPAGIIAVLEKVGSEFAAMEANTRAQEATDQAQFEDDMKDNKIAKAGREQEVQTKSAEKSRQVEILDSLTKARKHTSSELEQVEQYLKDLVPACGAGDSTYDDRKAARAMEIASLKEAQIILGDAFKAGAPAPAPAAAASLLAPKQFLRH